MDKNSILVGAEIPKGTQNMYFFPCDVLLILVGLILLNEMPMLRCHGLIPLNKVPCFDTSDGDDNFRTLWFDTAE